jgi:hypothetical protein
MPKPTYRIFRKGEFTADLSKTNQCGREGMSKFNFEVTIEVNSLDQHGFVCDNFDVPKAFERFATGKWEASCEAFAGGGIYLMKSLCQNRALRIICRIQPIDAAWVEVDWKKGDEMPALYPKRLDKSRPKKFAVKSYR